MTHTVQLGTRHFVGFLLPDSTRSVGKGRAKKTLGTFTVLMPDIRIVSDIEIAKQGADLAHMKAVPV